jgi:hypothetical protein
MSDRDERVALFADEARRWAELHSLVDPMTDAQIERPGYYVEGWSVKDMIAHLGSWLAAAGAVLDRIRFDTYRPDEIDVDAMNQTFLDAMRHVPLADVRAQATASRTRMLSAWRALPEPSPEADRWIAKAGPSHYAEHLPRLREWAAELGVPAPPEPTGRAEGSG